LYDNLCIKNFKLPQFNREPVYHNRVRQGLELT
jgi:hypothetical protein